MPLTKKTKLAADYHVWEATELADGDIIDICASLGNRPANQLTIKNPGADITYKLNVVHKVYQNQSVQNNWMPHAGFWENPILVDEVEYDKDEIVIASGETHFYNNEIAIEDIKLITISSGLLIIAN